MGLIYDFDLKSTSLNKINANMHLLKFCYYAMPLPRNPRSASILYDLISLNPSH